MTDFETRTVERESGTKVRIVLSPGTLRTVPKYQLDYLLRIARHAPEPWPPVLQVVLKEEQANVDWSVPTLSLAEWFTDELKRSRELHGFRRLFSLYREHLFFDDRWVEEVVWCLAWYVPDYFPRTLGEEVDLDDEDAVARAVRKAAATLQIPASWQENAWGLLGVPLFLTSSLVLLTSAILLTPFIYLSVHLFRGNPRALFRLARAQWAWRRGRAYNQTKDKLLNMGITPEQRLWLMRSTLPPEATTVRSLRKFIQMARSKPSDDASEGV